MADVFNTSNTRYLFVIHVPNMRERQRSIGKFKLHKRLLFNKRPAKNAILLVVYKKRPLKKLFCCFQCCKSKQNFLLLIDISLIFRSFTTRAFSKLRFEQNNLSIHSIVIFITSYIPFLFLLNIENRIFYKK